MASEYNDYLKRFNETQNDLVKPQNFGQSDDYYQMARDQEYGLLFDKEVALENAKANAMKYTQNSINAQGFGGTGFGSSMQSGIYNTYLNKANEAMNDYASNIRQINQQEQNDLENKANDRFESVTTMITQADSLENVNQLLSDYGYGTIDKDGNFEWNAEKPEGMSDDDWYQMQYYYRMRTNDLTDETESADSQWANNVYQIIGGENANSFTYDDIKQYNAMNGTGGYTTEGFDKIEDLLVSGANGDVVSIDYSDKKGSSTKYYIVYNGKLYEVDKGIIGDKEPSVKARIATENGRIKFKKGK